MKYFEYSDTIVVERVIKLLLIYDDLIRISRQERLFAIVES